LLMEDLQTIRPRKRRWIGWGLQQQIVAPDLRMALAARTTYVAVIIVAAASIDSPDDIEVGVSDIEPTMVVSDAVGLRERGQRSDERLMAAGRYFPNAEVCHVARDDQDVSIALVIESNAGYCAHTHDVRARLDLLVHR